jgi:hypothetical protein
LLKKSSVPPVKEKAKFINKGIITKIPKNIRLGRRKIHGIPWTPTPL